MEIIIEKRKLGTSDIEITPILMGTWQAGKTMWVGIEDAETIKAIRSAFAAGITTIDTAEVYGNSIRVNNKTRPYIVLILNPYSPIAKSAIIGK
ncbi:aldo/keto reductase [[Phormidium ambiguum] IAM M-71]|uniref:aldo/keto reductase n=1 Tax=[Phormidium ambiguum] IAM M-71 TaxID=454136 RepID=UPI0026A12518